MKLDVIVPTYTIQPDFQDYIKNWFKELPINTLYLGLGKDDIEKPLDDNIVLVYQDTFKTLGYCLADLMKCVRTKWFIYLHSDVKIAPYNFDIMKRYMKEGVGAIEGSPLLFRGGNKSLLGRHWQDRAYSGFQVFRTEAVQDIIQKIEDDYIYRNEDFVFPEAIIQQGYTYEKAMSTYYHINEGGYVKNEKDSRHQIYGLIKYTRPTDFMKKIMVITINHYYTKYNKITSEDISKFASENNPKWVKGLQSSRYIKKEEV